MGLLHEDLGGMRPRTYILILNWIGWPLVAIYIVAMLVVPFVQSSFNWSVVQGVWDRWQGLNVGMLVFLASIIAFNISRYNAERERERNFLAARAFLPHALSELTKYCTASINFFAEAWKRPVDQDDNLNIPLKSTVPNFPKNYREVFRDCIKTAEPEVGDFLARILMKLQIHHSRMQVLSENFAPNSKIFIGQTNILLYFYRIAEIQALINQIFDYARGLKDFDNPPLEWENYRVALSAAGLWISEYDNLEDYIRSAISRGATDV